MKENGAAAGQNASKRGGPPTVSQLGILFLVYLFVSSGFFVDNILKGLIPDSVNSVSGQVSNKGVIVTGTLLVVFYAGVLVLKDAGIL